MLAFDKRLWKLVATPLKKYLKFNNANMIDIGGI